MYCFIILLNLLSNHILQTSNLFGQSLLDQCALSYCIAKFSKWVKMGGLNMSLVFITFLEVRSLGGSSEVVRG